MCMRMKTAALALAACALATVRRVDAGQEINLYAANHAISYSKDDNSLFKISCTQNTPLDSIATSRFSKRLDFTTVEIKNCGPVKLSYVDALHALNIGVTNNLSIFDIPSFAQFVSSDFKSWPSVLQMTATGPSILEAEPDALVGYTNLKRLRLERVRADILPPNIDFLTLLDTGIIMLPDNAINVIELEVEENSLKLIKGSPKRMRSLKLKAPALQSLLLSDAKLNLLPAGFAQECASLVSLSLVRMQGVLPLFFLRGAPRLRTFKIVDSGLTELPEDLFLYTPQLERIEMIDNRIKKFPRDLFSGLEDLKILLLDNNQLQASDLRAIAPILSLTELGLSGNPLGDLCAEGEVSSLSALQYLTGLFLRNTQLTRICLDWTRDMRELITLDLRNNKIVNLYCLDFRISRAVSTGYPVIDLTQNDIALSKCDKEQYDYALNKPLSTQNAKLMMSSIPCQCGAAWLTGTIRELSFEFTPEFQHRHCTWNLDCKSGLPDASLLDFRHVE